MSLSRDAYSLKSCGINILPCLSASHSTALCVKKLIVSLYSFLEVGRLALSLSTKLTHSVSGNMYRHGSNPLVRTNLSLRSSRNAAGIITLPFGSRELVFLPISTHSHLFLMAPHFPPFLPTFLHSICILLHLSANRQAVCRIPEKLKENFFLPFWSDSFLCTTYCIIDLTHIQYLLSLAFLLTFCNKNLIIRRVEQQPSWYSCRPLEKPHINSL